MYPPKMGVYKGAKWGKMRMEIVILFRNCAIANGCTKLTKMANYVIIASC